MPFNKILACCRRMEYNIVWIFLNSVKRFFGTMSDTNGKLNNPNRGNRNRLLLLVLQGAIIGVGAILPGISGGVLCVIFGLYKPVIEVMSNPLVNLKYHWKVIIPVALGVGLGFLGSAGAVSAFMEKNAVAGVCVFVGLILGMLPDLWKDAGAQGRTPASVPSMIGSFAVFLALLTFLKTGVSMDITPTVFWYGVCGIAWGLSFVVPGLSSSSMLIFLGLYQPMLAGMARLDFGVLIPLGVGAALIVLTLSRAVNILFEKHYSLASHIIFGIVLATTAVIVPTDFAGAGQLAVCGACVIAGIGAAIAISRICDKIAVQRMEENK